MVETARSYRPDGVQVPGYAVETFGDLAALPLVITHDGNGPINLLDARVRALALDALRTVGGVLFRNFSVASPIEFKRFAASFGKTLGTYEFGSTPRNKIFAGVYSSTEYPPDQTIPQHNEQSYTCKWPEWIWFHCIQPSATGGQTPVSDSRKVFALLPQALREEFLQKKLLYVRNYSEALDLPWQKVFNTTDPVGVERFCLAQGIEWEWKPQGELRTRQYCQAALQHPHTNEWVWFNQAHLFHISATPPSVRAALMETVGEPNLPRNVYFGDGTPIPDTALDIVRATYEKASITFNWQAGDVLMLDNLLTAHGRNPFTGDRKVIVAMA